MKFSDPESIFSSVVEETWCGDTEVKQKIITGHTMWTSDKLIRKRCVEK